MKKNTGTYLSANSITYKIIYFFAFFGADFNFLGNLPYVKGGNKPFTSKKGKNSDENIYSKSMYYKKVEKFFIFLGRFRPLRDFYLMQQENNF